MRKRRSAEADEAEVDMTPMLDVVFILLIFFIVTSTFLNEYGFDLTPPPPTPPDQIIKPKPAVTINVDETNMIFVDGRPTDIGSVRANIERRKAENPEIAVVIVASTEAKNRYVMEVFDQAKLSNVANVNVVPAAE